jgi:hypothetical protein
MPRTVAVAAIVNGSTGLTPNSSAIAPTSAMTICARSPHSSGASAVCSVAGRGQAAFRGQHLHQPIAAVAAKKVAEILCRPESFEHAVVELDDQPGLLSPLPAVGHHPDDKAQCSEEGRKKDPIAAHENSSESLPQRSGRGWR